MNPQRVRNGVEVGRIKVWGGSHLEICKEFFHFLIFEYTGIAKLMKYHDCFVNGHSPKPIRGMHRLLSLQKKALCGCIACWVQLPKPFMGLPTLPSCCTSTPFIYHFHLGDCGCP